MVYDQDEDAREANVDVRARKVCSNAWNLPPNSFLPSELEASHRGHVAIGELGPPHRRVRAPDGRDYGPQWTRAAREISSVYPADFYRSRRRGSNDHDCTA